VIDRALTLTENSASTKSRVQRKSGCDGCSDDRPERILQVFLNLIINASGHGGGGSLMIETSHGPLAGRRSDGHGAGSGREPGADLRSFFTTKETGRVGLPITRRILEEHDGRSRWTAPS